MRRDGRTPSVGCTLFGLGALAAIGIGVFVISALTGDGGAPDRAASTTTTLPVVETAPPTTAPASFEVDARAPVVATHDHYAVTYRVETHSGQFLLVDTEVRRFARPFRSEVLTFDAEPDEVPADASAASERSVHVFGGFETGAPADPRTVLTIVPGPPARSAHFGGDLARAVEEGLVRFTGTGLRIAGRDCDVYETRSPLDVTRLEPPTPDDHTELCIAPDGLVLRESWTAAGDLFRVRTAVAIEDLPVPDERFTLDGFRIPNSVGGGRVRALTPDSTAPGAPHLLPASLPPGFESIGRYVYVADAADPGTGDVRIDRIVSLVDVFVSDDHVLVVENGGSVEGGVSAEADALAVEVPGHPDAAGLVRTHQSSVFIPVERRFVRLSSTLPLAVLEELAVDLVDVPGTGEVTPLSDELDVTGRLSPEDLDEHDHDDAGGEHSHDGSTHTHS